MQSYYYHGLDGTPTARSPFDDAPMNSRSSSAQPLQHTGSPGRPPQNPNFGHPSPAAAIRGGGLPRSLTAGLLPVPGVERRAANRSSATWTSSSGDLAGLSDTDDVQDRHEFVREYNRLAQKHGIRMLVLEACDNQRSPSTEHSPQLRQQQHHRKRDWFVRTFFRQSSATSNASSSVKSIKSAKSDVKKVHHARSFSDMALHIVHHPASKRRDSLKDEDLQGLVRLCGKSMLYLPSEYAPCSLVLPTCFRATAQYLVQHAADTRGVFRIPGSVRQVSALYDYYCTEEDPDEISHTTRCPNLPSHIKISTHDVASTFKRFLFGLPGGILGSLPLFDALVAIHSQLKGDPEFTRTKQTKLRARLIALAIGSVKSQFRRELICAVFGLLCLIGRTAERAPREDEYGRPLPTADLMGYNALGIVFGPLLVGDLINSYTMKVASPSDGLVLFPVTPPQQHSKRGRRKSKVASVASSEDANSSLAGALTVDKIHVANNIAEMLITHWREVVKQMRSLGVMRASSNMEGVPRGTNIGTGFGQQQAGWRSVATLRPSASDAFVIHKPSDWNTGRPGSAPFNKHRGGESSVPPSPTPEPRGRVLGSRSRDSGQEDKTPRQSSLLGQRQRPKNGPRSLSCARAGTKSALTLLSPTAEEPTLVASQSPLKDHVNIPKVHEGPFSENSPAAIPTQFVAAMEEPPHAGKNKFSALQPHSAVAVAPALSTPFPPYLELAANGAVGSSEASQNNVSADTTRPAVHPAGQSASPVPRDRRLLVTKDSIRFINDVGARRREKKNKSSQDTQPSSTQSLPEDQRKPYLKPPEKAPPPPARPGPSSGTGAEDQGNKLQLRSDSKSASSNADMQPEARSSISLDDLHNQIRNFRGKNKGEGDKHATTQKPDEHPRLKEMPSSGGFPDVQDTVRPDPDTSGQAQSGLRRWKPRLPATAVNKGKGKSSDGNGSPVSRYQLSGVLVDRGHRRELKEQEADSPLPTKMGLESPIRAIGGQKQPSQSLGKLSAVGSTREWDSSPTRRPREKGSATKSGKGSSERLSGTSNDNPYPLAIGGVPTVLQRAVSSARRSLEDIRPQEQQKPSSHASRTPQTQRRLPGQQTSTEDSGRTFTYGEKRSVKTDPEEVGDATQTSPSRRREETCYSQGKCVHHDHEQSPSKAPLTPRRLMRQRSSYSLLLEEGKPLNIIPEERARRDSFLGFPAGDKPPSPIAEAPPESHSASQTQFQKQQKAPLMAPRTPSTQRRIPGQRSGTEDSDSRQSFESKSEGGHEAIVRRAMPKTPTKNDPPRPSITSPEMDPAGPKASEALSRSHTVKAMAALFENASKDSNSVPSPMETQNLRNDADDTKPSPRGGAVVSPYTSTSDAKSPGATSIRLVNRSDSTRSAHPDWRLTMSTHRGDQGSEHYSGEGQAPSKVTKQIVSPRWRKHKATISADSLASTDVKDFSAPAVRSAAISTDNGGLAMIASVSSPKRLLPTTSTGIEDTTVTARAPAKTQDRTPSNRALNRSESSIFRLQMPEKKPTIKVSPEKRKERSTEIDTVAHTPGKIVMPHIFCREEPGPQSTIEVPLLEERSLGNILPANPDKVTAYSKTTRQGEPSPTQVKSHKRTATATTTDTEATRAIAGTFSPEGGAGAVRSSSNSTLHAQIRSLQKQLEARTEEVTQLRRKLETKGYSGAGDVGIGTLSEQLRQAKLECQMWREKAEAAEKRVVMFEQFTARIRKMKQRQKGKSLERQSSPTMTDSMDGLGESDEGPNVIRFPPLDSSGEHTEDGTVVADRIRKSLQAAMDGMLSEEEHEGEQQQQTNVTENDDEGSNWMSTEEDLLEHQNILSWLNDDDYDSDAHRAQARQSSAEQNWQVD